MVAVAACSYGGTAPAPASPSASARPPALGVIDTSDATTWKAEIVGTGGKVLAQAAFGAPDRHPLGYGGLVVPIAAHASAGALFYADGSGVIHRLARDDTGSVAGRVPLTTSPSQILTFGVSPDGAQVAASVLTVGSGTALHWHLDQYRGPADGSALRQVASQDLGTQLPRPTMVVDWDTEAPVAALRLTLAADAPPISTRFPDTPIVHLDPSGGLSAPIGGPECGIALDETPEQVVLCTTDGRRLNVRSADGTIRWQVDVAGQDGVGAPKALAPDGSKIAGLGVIYTESGKRVDLLAHFVPLGWLDPQTVVGRATDQHLWLEPAGGSAGGADLGLAGVYVGRV